MDSPQDRTDDFGADDRRAAVRVFGRFLPVIVVLAAGVAAATFGVLSDYSADVTAASRLFVVRRDVAATQEPVDTAFLESQAKFLASRDVLRQVAGELRLDGLAEFQRPSLATRILAAVGGKPKLVSPEERLAEALASRFSAVPVSGERVINVSFRAADADLAVRFVDRVVADYVTIQSTGGGVDARVVSEAKVTTAPSALLAGAGAGLAAAAVLVIGLLAALAAATFARRERAADAFEEMPAPVDRIEPPAATPAPRPGVQPSPPEAAQPSPPSERGRGRRAGDGRTRAGRTRVAVASVGDGNDNHRLIDELARDGGFESARIVVIDASRKSGTVPGLSELLSGDAEFSDVIRRNAMTRTHEISIGRRPLGSHPGDDEAAGMLFDALEQTYDLVFVDLGGLRADAGFMLLARLAGHLILVGDADKGAVDTLLDALARRGVAGVTRVRRLVDVMDAVA